MPQYQELKDRLMQDIELKQSIVDMFAHLIKRQTQIMVGSLGLALLVVLLFIYMSIKPTHVDKDMMKFLEEERSSMQVEKRELKEQQQRLIDSRNLYFKYWEQLNKKDSILHLKNK